MRCDHTNFSTHLVILCTSERRNLLNLKSVCSSYQNTLQYSHARNNKSSSNIKPKAMLLKYHCPDTSPSSSFIIHNSIHQKIIITLKKMKRFILCHYTASTLALLRFIFYIMFCVWRCCAISFHHDHPWSHQKHPFKRQWVTESVQNIFLK